eukprot:NODE_3802_length_1982_cov_14.599461.p3 GENE.NODE_3802_length_1982_cov_14.599461~~NODE_3802_length_1982_cov_14.599461.p3  ORF type:complete len:70 (-),score=1.45 NODE_3802_length_1982_cov_14.599461:597-806(-)
MVFPRGCSIFVSGICKRPISSMKRCFMKQRVKRGRITARIIHVLKPHDGNCGIVRMTFLENNIGFALHI